MSIGHTLQTAYYLTDVKGVKKVEQVAEERDLGILITDDMKWRNQLNSTQLNWCNSGVTSVILQQQRLCLCSAGSKEPLVL